MPNKAPPETHTNVMHDNAIAFMNHPSARQPPLHRRVLRENSSPYFVIMGLGAAAAGAAGEIESVTHAFQPSGRFCASNSL